MPQALSHTGMQLLVIDQWMGFDDVSGGIDDGASVISAMAETNGLPSV